VPGEDREYVPFEKDASFHYFHVTQEQEQEQDNKLISILKFTTIDISLHHEVPFSAPSFAALALGTRYRPEQGGR
jgi:hypothetical protein